MPSRRTTEPLFVAPSGAEVKADARATGGTVGVVETAIPAGPSAPLHVHAHEDEAFYVLSGAVDFRCGDRVLVLLMPGGLEEAFAMPSHFDESLARHGVEVVGPPLGPSESVE